MLLKPLSNNYNHKNNFFCNSIQFFTVSGKKEKGSMGASVRRQTASGLNKK